MGNIQVKSRLQRVGFADQEKYLTSAVRYSTISMEELINYAAENSGISKASMAAAFYALQQQIEQFVCNGHNIQLGNLGQLYIGANAKAADSEKEAGATAVYRLSVKFRQSKKLREHLNNNVTLISSGTSATASAPSDTDTGGGGGGSHTDLGDGGDEFDPNEI